MNPGTKTAARERLKRLFLYKICLVRMKRMGIKRVFSYSIGPEAGVTPELVRKDFSELTKKDPVTFSYKIFKEMFLLHTWFVENLI